MELIIGGAYQGKTEFVKSAYRLQESDISDGNTMDYEQTGPYICINHVHFLIRRIWREGKEPKTVLKKILADSPNVILILDEIGSGIVPVEWEQRRWREQVGMAGCYLAGEARRVIRLACGIPNIIKETADAPSLRHAAEWI